MLSFARKLMDAGCRLFNRMCFHYYKVDCLTDLRNINGMIRVAGSGRILIGKGTRINSGRRRNPIGGDTCVTFVCRNGGVVDIGENCGLSNCTIVSDSQVKLEAEVLIGGGVKIYDTDFHSLDPQQRRMERVGHFHGSSRPVTVGRNAFIGAHTIILKGTRIGENSVVGAGSVVSGIVPPNEIWAGNPARRVRSIDVGTINSTDKPHAKRVA